MRSRPLGGQTVTVIEQVRPEGGRHNELVDGPRTSWSSCSVQPSGDPSESTNREQRTVARWRLFAPADFAARAVDEVEVVPGPQTVNATGQTVPARLKLDGPIEQPPGSAGATHHVTAVLVRRTG